MKTGTSAYNDSRKGCQWTKLKKGTVLCAVRLMHRVLIAFADYIDGLGDSASFVVVGVGHNKERGRQLGGQHSYIRIRKSFSQRNATVGPQTWTTFFMGLQTNRQAVSANVGFPREPAKDPC